MIRIIVMELYDTFCSLLDTISLYFCMEHITHLECASEYLHKVALLTAQHRLVPKIRAHLSVLDLIYLHI